VFEQVAVGLAEAGVGLDVLAVDFFPHQGVELGHEQPAVRLMMPESLGRGQSLRLGLGWWTSKRQTARRVSSTWRHSVGKLGATVTNSRLSVIAQTKARIV
jgi:hypothetical protein